VAVFVGVCVSATDDVGIGVGGRPSSRISRRSATKLGSNHWWNDSLESSSQSAISTYRSRNACRDRSNPVAKPNTRV